MNMFKSALGLCFLGIVFSACSQKNDTISQGKQVAQRQGELIICDGSLLKETIAVPLSTLTEDLEIVKLDNSDEALVRGGEVIFSENYLLVKGSGQIPYKLFDKKTGNLRASIGSYGEGPNEYTYVYDQQLDEENNRIYLLPWTTRKILVFDLDGNPLEPIPLSTMVPKGNFKVDTKAETVIVSVLPFSGRPAVIWQQTTDGTLLQHIEPGHLEVPPTYNNEMSAYKCGKDYAFHIFTFDARKDSLYHYNADENKIFPVFTINFKNDIPIHTYKELPNYYIGRMTDPKQVSEDTWITENERFYIVDKNTLKGSLFTLYNDFLGGISLWPESFIGNYYVSNYDPGDLYDKLEKVLNENKDMAPHIKERVINLKNSITENDNNYIVYAKLKK